ncbi:hypothetical protein [Aquisalinus flavus]|uniref:Uncharacterized protein n=1 Tax=Aquisalinus flavus TaxID=1526572 RepID=A0A8J2Y874_9PROT|nr:hypothetical protein [Aquisalinus flavus]MBD0425576.1 hypothetical protein [Aquisalinus flavus]UNE48801.1 hypothetical protein FF099_12440 [Aquisalinus flavus]GGD14941.1 hypothetical protein GCM10011342_24670 [Aquisalinus flavus]
MTTLTFSVPGTGACQPGDIAAMTAEIPYGIGIIILLIALIWGATHYRLRSRRSERLSEEATREMYEEPERYDVERRHELEEEIEREEERTRQAENKSG